MGKRGFISEYAKEGFTYTLRNERETAEVTSFLRKGTHEISSADYRAFNIGSIRTFSPQHRAGLSNFSSLNGVVWRSRTLMALYRDLVQQ